MNKIPRNLIKLSATVLSKPLAIVINNSFNRGMFPGNTKITCVSLLGKHTGNKYYVINFRPVSVLNAFSKIFEKIVKASLTIQMEHHFSPFISAYRKSFGTEHALIRLLKDWRNKLDDNNVVDAVLTDLSKPFDCIPHDLLVAKLDIFGFHGDTVACIY